MVTIAEIRKSTQLNRTPEEIAYDSWYVRNVLRKVSPYFSKFFVSIGASANQVSILSIFVGFVGNFLLVFGNYSFMVISCIFYQFWFLFDVVDGEVARFMKSKTLGGEYLENINNVLTECSFIVAISIGLMMMLDATWYIILGLVFALMNSLLSNAAMVRNFTHVLRLGTDISVTRPPYQSFLGQVYDRFRAYFTSMHMGMYWVFTLLVFVTLILPYPFEFFFIGIQFNIFSAYFWVLGIVWSTRCIVSHINNYKKLQNLN